jgi:hypothetical protein
MTSPSIKEEELDFGFSQDAPSIPNGFEPEEWQRLSKVITTAVYHSSG